MSAVFKRIDPKPGPVQLPELPIGMVAADHAAANDGGAAAVPPKTTESLLRRGLRGIFQMAATGGATLLVKGVATSVLMGSSSVPALAIMAGSVAVTSLTGSLITTYFHQCRERRETGVNTKSFGQVFARKLMMSAAMSTVTLGAVHNWASISSFCGPAFNAAARFAQPVLEHSTVQNVMNALGNVAQKATHALAQYSPLQFAHAGDAESINYWPASTDQPVYGSGPAETTGGPGELKMYAPAAVQLPPIELTSPGAIHGDALPATHDGIAVNAAPPIAPMDVKSQVRALLEAGELDKKTAKMARAFLGNGQGTLSQRGHDFALELLKHHPTAQETELAHSLITDAANHGNKSAQKTVEYFARHGKFGFGPTAIIEPPAIAAECRMRGVEATYNGPVVVKNVDCAVHEVTMKPGDFAIVNGPYGMREQFKWGGDHTIPTGEFFFGDEQVTPGGFGESRAGWGVGRIAQSLASAFRGSADYVRGFGGKFTFQPFANTFTPAFQ